MQFKASGLAVITAGDFNYTEEELRNISDDNILVSRNYGPTRIDREDGTAIDHFQSTTRMTAVITLAT